IGNLVSDVVLAEIAEPCLVQSLAFQGHKTDRKAGGIELEHDGGQRAGRQPSEISHSQIGNHSDIGIRIRGRLKVDLDKADAWQRPRFDVIDAAPESKESLETAGDVRLDFFWRHSRVERSDHYNRDINIREQVNRHAEEAGRPHDYNDQAYYYYEVRVFYGKPRHSVLLIVGLIDPGRFYSDWRARDLKAKSFLDQP